MFVLPEGRPALMGILNVTPDSFSDGGQFSSAEAAVARGLAMVDEGADLVDVGGESTRPGAAPVKPSEEQDRVLPIVSVLASRGVPVSIDTRNPSTARLALEAGAVVVNDVSGLRSPEMRQVCAEFGCTVCIMHMQGDPTTMQQEPAYEDVVQEVRSYLVEQAANAQTCGIMRENIWIDPGIGFGKTLDHNLALLRSLSSLVELGYPVLIGVSRKGFIGKLLGGLPVEERLEGTLALQVAAQLAGGRVIRAHDVKASRRAMDVVAAL